MEPVLRHELKYIVDLRKHLDFKAELTGRMRLDGYSAAPGGYLVQSLYFDTRDYRLFSEKMHGDANRIKIRLRSYWDNAADAKFVNAEIKCRYNAMTMKYTTRLAPADVEAFVKDGFWPLGMERDEVFTEFERLRRLHSLRPVVTVQYYRQGFVPVEGGSLRLTFDHDISASEEASSFLSRAPLMRRLPEKGIVIEIKVRDDVPPWLEYLVRKYDLYSGPCSKYCRGIVHSQNRLVSLGW